MGTKIVAVVTLLDNAVMTESVRRMRKIKRKGLHPATMGDDFR